MQLKNLWHLAFVFALMASSFKTVHANTISFSYTGAAQTFIVPTNVSTIHIDAWGAQGYSAIQYSNNIGGLGGFTSGDLNVTAGELLYVYVGGAGTEANVVNVLAGGGFNGGGDGVVWNNGTGLAGGGGGASDVRLSGGAFGDRVLVAGGGGGATANFHAAGGNGGGLIGQNGQADVGYYPGLGGTQTGGGAVNAGFGYGGDAINNGNNGWVGGGGGGWYGGGASPAHFAGGGGSSYIGGVFNGQMYQGVETGNGFVEISFNVNAVPEPSSLALLSLGGIGSAISVFRRRRQQAV